MNHRRGDVVDVAVGEAGARLRTVRWQPLPPPAAGPASSAL